ncbi:MAG: hypothetical protein PQJ59_03725 [Spirochaetales bacterium]|nr:hypothetical protein [Spirochaetales bacterium]
MIKRILLILPLTLFFFSCVTTSMPFEYTVEGYSLGTDIDKDILEKSIKIALMKYNWIPYEEVPGSIKSQFSKSEGLITCDIQVLYNDGGYSINYLGSKNLDENLKRMTIHKNYNRWIANLNKVIYENYLLAE